MKKFFIVGILFTLVLFSANAQRFYFDIGLGIGKAWTKIDGTDISDSFKSAGVNFSEIGVDFGLKAGYGPAFNIPIYITGVLTGVGHRLSFNSNYVQFNSYLIGPGVIFYPIPNLQIAGSIGYSWTGNTSSYLTNMYKSQGGFAGDISIAYDLGKGNHGCLLGLRYFGSSNKLEVSNAKQSMSVLSVFARYTFRQKI